MADSITRGGQVIGHSWRMRIQVVKTILKYSLYVAIICYVYLVFSTFTSHQLYWIVEWYRADLLYTIKKDMIMTTRENGFINGDWHKRYAHNIVFNPTILMWKAVFWHRVNTAVYQVLWVLLAAIFVILFVFWAWGRRLTKSQFIEGNFLVNAKKLHKLVNRYNFKKRLQRGIFKRHKPYKVVGVPYPYNTETMHTLFVGRTGSGKTVAINPFIEQARKRGDRMVIFDRMGSYTKIFYDARQDVLLNPLDMRCPQWSIFNEATDHTYFDSMAEALIPSGLTADQFWEKAARILFSSIAGKMQAQGACTNKDLIHNLLNASVEEILKAVEKTYGQNLISKESERMVKSIQAVLINASKSLWYLTDEGQRFSIREWISNSDRKGFLFLPSSGDMHATLKPLISMWLEVAINSLISLEQSQQRKIWFMLDEVSSLHKIPSLLSGLTESRQFGGCFVLGVQGLSALKENYGQNAATTIVNNLCTHVCFAQTNSEEAEMVSKNLGDTKTEYVKESQSFGANTIRDGSNLNKEVKTERVVTATDIINLPSLGVYLKLSEGMPIGKIQLKYEQYPEVAAKIIRRKLPNIMGEFPDEPVPQASEVPDIPKQPTTQPVPQQPQPAYTAHPQQTPIVQPPIPQAQPHQPPIVQPPIPQTQPQAMPQQPQQHVHNQPPQKKDMQNNPPLPSMDIPPVAPKPKQKRPTWNKNQNGKGKSRPYTRGRHSQYRQTINRGTDTNAPANILEYEAYTRSESYLEEMGQEPLVNNDVKPPTYKPTQQQNPTSGNADNNKELTGWV